MNTILDQKVADLMTPSFPDGEWDQRDRARKHREHEEERLRKLDRLLTAVHRNGMAYFDAYRQLEECAIDNPNVTCRVAVKQLDGVRLGAVKDELVLLDTAAQAMELARQRVLRQLDCPPVDALGRVLLDQGTSPPRRTPSGTPDDRLRIEPSTFEQVMNQPLHSERLARARMLTGQYEGPEGAKQFGMADRAHAEGGADLVAGLQRAHAIATADRAAQVAGASLDQALQADTQRERKKMLDRALKRTARLLDEMEQPPPDRMELQAVGPDSNPVRLLHQQVQQRRRESGRPYLVELDAIA